MVRIYVAENLQDFALYGHFRSSPGLDYAHFRFKNVSFSKPLDSLVDLHEKIAV